MATLNYKIPATLDIEHYRGDYFAQQITYSTKDGDDPAVPIDLTGYEIRAHIKKASGGSKVAEFSIEDRDDVNGIFKLVLNPEDTANLKITDFNWDCELTNPSGNVYTLLSGTFTLTLDTTT